MPDQEKTEKTSAKDRAEARDEDAAAAAADDDDDDDDAHDDDESSDSAMFSNFGIGSAVLGLVCVVAMVLGGLIWFGHRDESAERVYLSRAMSAAADWTNILINMNTGNIDASLQRLHDGTVGQLNTDFEAAFTDYRKVVEKLQAHSRGDIEAVAIDTVHRDIDTVPGSPRPVVATKLPAFASRTDSVLLVATSISENNGAKPQMVHWSLRLDVSNVGGKMLISKLESIR